MQRPNAYLLVSPLMKAAAAGPSSPWATAPGLRPPPAAPGAWSRIGAGVARNKYSIGLGIAGGAVGGALGSAVPVAGTIAGGLGGGWLGETIGGGLDSMANRAAEATHSATGRLLNRIPGVDIMGRLAPGSVYDWAMGNKAGPQLGAAAPVTDMASYGAAMVRQGMQENRNK